MNKFQNFKNTILNNCGILEKKWRAYLVNHSVYIYYSYNIFYKDC